MNRLNHTCFTRQFNQTRDPFDGTRDNDGSLHLKSLQELFFADQKYNYSYEGVATIRGVSVDVWISLRDLVPIGRVNLTNVKYELYFTQPGLRSSALNSRTNQSILWRLALSAAFNRGNTSIPFSYVADVIGASYEEPPNDVYDVHECFNSSGTTQVQLSIVSSDPLSLNFTRFTGALRKTLQDYAKRIGMDFVSPLQITAIRASSHLC